MYDIQFGTENMGFGLFYPNGTYYYDGFFSYGSTFSDLPYARRFESAFNCTRGFSLMNVTQPYYNAAGLQEIVWTDLAFTGANTPITKGVDVFYPGTCEADNICYRAAATTVSTQSIGCAGGFVCDERTTATKSAFYQCRAGYVCDVGTTPDQNIEAPQGQFSQLCPAGYYCVDSTSATEEYSFLCPAGYFCPTGTGVPWLGTVANDAINRGLSAVEANPFLGMRHVRYLANDDVRIVSDHDALCFHGVDSEYSEQFFTDWLAEGMNLSNPYIDFLRVAVPGKAPYQNDSILTGHDDGAYYRPSVINAAVESNLRCARDQKWRLTSDVLYREECDCIGFVEVVIAVYRLWKCTSDGSMENLGLAAVNPPFNGGRNFWFPRKFLTSNLCIFEDSPDVTLVQGRVGEYSTLPAIGADSLGLLNLTSGLTIQISWELVDTFITYSLLKQTIYSAWAQLSIPLQPVDPYMFNIYKAVELIEEHGEYLEDLVWLEDAVDMYGAPTKISGRLDICACQNLLRCPNGTVSSPGAAALSDCTVPSTAAAVVRRIGAIPSWLNSSSPGLIGKLSNVSDFNELTGYQNISQSPSQSYPLGSISLLTFDVSVVTLKLTDITHNLTYGVDYRISAYVDCKPCPTRYFIFNLFFRLAYLNILQLPMRLFSCHAHLYLSFAQ